MPTAPTFLLLIVFCLQLEVRLRVLANRAELRSLLAYNDVTAVAALPDAIAVAREHYAVLNVLQEFAIALLVMLLDSTYA